ncbi:regulator of chromosome condensation 1/beta-lactamase-inhibitor protein II [Bombardia bombarda]|uniref:Regulator of chromosome condensation 1/beta-lactamase-inhibitor protein II n=1 Tax=Bombardia bombarda TaxID=252184 RepID=A0AA39X6H0_9PEZI|nr:regulator of chromosome condensation 1/beta-lactamase-inhibitor protein II [Bombardia bombarda]
MGANSGGELGLGSSVLSGTVHHPRLNPFLSGAVGVVQVSAGAMHGAALTKDSRILTWGVNDHGALGRDTTWDGVPMRDADDDDSDSSVDSIESNTGDLNPRESTPTDIDATNVARGVVFTQVAAAHNATFALTNTGLVYGWGTFRANKGELAFSPTVRVQERPILIPQIKYAIKIVTGGDHVLVLRADGSVYSWGVGTEGQLGRRFSSRRMQQDPDAEQRHLIPEKVATLKNIIDIGSGSKHSFAIDTTGRVWAWGLNNAGQTGLSDQAGEYGGYSHLPAPVRSLEHYGRIAQITGGAFHSIAVTADGRCLTWGRLYSFATGLRINSLADQSILRDSRGRPAILTAPTAVPGLRLAVIAAESDHSLTITLDHKVYTWGLNVSSQLGHKSEEIEVATLLKDASIANKRMVWAGAGSQYCMLGEVSISMS